MKELVSILKREYSYLRNTPYLGVLELTYRCNCRCLTCDVWKLPKREELSLRELFLVIDQMKELGIDEVLLAGAEPFMRDDIVSIIRYIKKKGLNCSVTTNATIIDAKVAKELCECGLDNVIVSIDRVGKGHDLMRSHEGAFDKAVTAISHLKKAREDLVRTNPFISIHVTLSNLNVAEVGDMWHLKKRIGADSIGYSYACQTKEEHFRSTLYKGRRIASSRILFKEKSLSFSDSNIRDLEDCAKKMKERDFKLPFSLKSLIRWKHSNLKESTVPIKRCYAARNIVTIDPYGDVLPCPNLDGFKYGNIREENLISILNSSRRKYFLKRIFNSLFPACRSCTNFSLTPIQLIRVLLGMKLRDRGNFV